MVGSTGIARLVVEIQQSVNSHRSECNLLHPAWVIALLVDFCLVLVFLSSKPRTRLVKPDVVLNAQFALLLLLFPLVVTPCLLFCYRCFACGISWNQVRPTGKISCGSSFHSSSITACFLTSLFLIKLSETFQKIDRYSNNSGSSNYPPFWILGILAM